MTKRISLKRRNRKIGLLLSFRRFIKLHIEILTPPQLELQRPLAQALWQPNRNML